MDEVIFHSELEVVFSLMEEKELVRLRDALNYLIEKGAFQLPNFPLSCGGLRYVEVLIDDELKRKRGEVIPSRHPQPDREVGAEMAEEDVIKPPRVQANEGKVIL